MTTQGRKWMCETRVLLLSEWYLFIYLEEMEILSGRVNKWAIERVVRWEGKGEDSDRGKKESMLNYWLHIYILTRVLCIAFCICPDSAPSGLPFGGSRCRNTEREEHPDHLRCHRRSQTLVWGTAETISIHWLLIHFFFHTCIRVRFRQDSYLVRFRKTSWFWLK